MLRRQVILFLSLAIALAPAMLCGQATGDDDQNQPPTPRPAAGAKVAPKGTLDGTHPVTGSDGLPNTEPVSSPPQIVVNAPPPAPAPWTWHDRVLWGAEILLAILGYVGVMVGLKTLKSIQSQTEFGVSAAKAALQCANAALESSQAIVDSGRPWIVVTVEPFMNVEHGFKVMASNRGRTPAKIVATTDLVRLSPDETKLPPEPDFSSAKTGNLSEPIILLPGESAGIRRFRREDIRALCKSEDELRRIEKWEEKIFIYGRVSYRDMISPTDQPNHETDWCCRYVYAEKDALVIAGPPDYNKHK
jgi:hypothetical protein